MYPVAFAPRQAADMFLLITPGEIETRNIGARIQFVVPDGNNILAVRDFLPHGFTVIQAVTALIDTGDARCLANT